MRLEYGKENVEQIHNAVMDILSKNTLLSLSTYADNKIWTSTVFFSYDNDLNFYFVSDPETRHCQMITQNKKVSGAIYSTNAVWGTDIQGIQFEATADRVPTALTIFQGTNYLKRFPVATKFISSPELFLSKKNSVRLFRLSPRMLQLYDEVTILEGDPIRRLIFD